MVSIYTDGGCNVHTDKAGAWAFVAVEDGEKIYQGHGRELNTTNGRMEVIAFLQALIYCNRKLQSKEVQIYCDSNYCVRGYNEWVDGWKRKNWVKSNGKDVMHVDAWKQISELNLPNVKVSWVKGHDGDEWNEYVDRLCKNR